MTKFMKGAVGVCVAASAIALAPCANADDDSFLANLSQHGIFTFKNPQGRTMLRVKSSSVNPMRIESGSRTPTYPTFDGVEQQSLAGRDAVVDSTSTPQDLSRPRPRSGRATP